jgi:hypothetical protein
MERSRVLEDYGPERLYDMHMKKMQELEKVVL